MPSIDPFSARPGFEHGHLAAIVESSSDAIISKDLDGIIRSWNRAAERIFGWKQEEIVGQSIRTLIPADCQNEEDDILSRVRKGELVPKFETVRLHKDGSTLAVAITVSPIRSDEGAIVGASKIAHPIKHEVEFRRTLQESEARFRALADNIPQLAWMADSEGWIFWYNKRWFDYTGTDLAAMEGWGWKKVHHPDHIDRVVARIQQCFDTGEEWEDTFPLRGADGSFRWFLSRAKPIFDADGRVRLWFGTNTDITQQREHEQQIDLLMGEVNHRSKNILALIQAILHRTGRHIDPDFVRDFERRIAALAANQDLLIRRGWSGVAMGDLVRSQLSAYEELFDERIIFSGPEGMVLRPSAAEALGLAIHELGTNAVKYGALSNDKGRLYVEWAVGGTEADPRFRLSWREIGGPPVKPPSRKGFGSVLTSRNVERSMSATVTQEFKPKGLVWSFDAPLAQVDLPDQIPQE
ncbi:sensor histidine kinase [Sphingomonas jaspsi]|uniref:sensor histidine kinase n=1 Tax=Sphingomonas jaspsi TaxID=392409 RepID=UPI0004B08255|nr:PAS domain S-box protein [Sphingomonas jaspsi]